MIQNSLEKYSTFNLKKKPTKAHRISHNNNDILVKCMKYKTVGYVYLLKTFNFRPLGSRRPKPQKMEGKFPLCFE